MGFRFRRSVKLAPGLRLSFSGSGLSLSAGPRGASVTFGSRGTYLNTGIPGTGISARERIGGGPAPRTPATAPQKVLVNVKVEVDDEGNVTFKDSDGRPAIEYLMSKAKRERGEDIRALIESCCEKINAPVKALDEIHLQTPKPTQRIVFSPRTFDVPVPTPPIPKVPGFLANIFKSRAARIEEENHQVQLKYEAEVADRRRQAEVFLAEETQRKEFLEQRIFTDPAAMEQHLTHALEDIAWPRETNVSFEIEDGGKAIAIDVDLPEIEDLPKRTAYLPSTGYKIKFKTTSEGQLHKTYAAHVHGLGFRIIGETFALLPTIMTVTLSAYSQRPQAATATIADEYLYSVRVTRDAWSHINFANLAALDVVAALEQFELRREMLKSGRFKPIEPISSREHVSIATWQ